MFKYATFYVAFTNNKIYYVSNKRISKTNLIEDKMNREMLKEAIAEAKTIKETAIASAKAALEEAFTPQLTAMFAEKLNEMDEMDGVEETYDSMEEGDLSLEEILAELGVTEEEGMMAEEDTMMTEGDEDLMLEEMSDEDIEELVTQVIDDMIASGKLMAGEESDMDDMDDMDMDDMDMDVDIEDMDDENMDKEEIDIKDTEIDELLAEILGKEEDLEEGKKHKNLKKDDEDEELKEAYKAIAELRAELNVVNLLNAKLLYTNKIFKAKNLTESEKVKVLNTFDKAETVKEVKLVFETLTESFKATTAKKNPIKESLGGASKTIAAAPKQEQIIEVNDAFARMQRLAGLRK
jgi:outer membrane protein assembly factor BamE (lipoprotein component of BamABCDE complex)